MNSPNRDGYNTSYLSARLRLFRALDALPLGCDLADRLVGQAERGPAVAGLESGWPTLRSATWRRRLLITF